MRGFFPFPAFRVRMTILFLAAAIVRLLQICGVVRGGMDQSDGEASEFFVLLRYKEAALDCAGVKKRNAFDPARRCCGGLPPIPQRTRNGWGTQIVVVLGLIHPFRVLCGMG